MNYLKAEHLKFKRTISNKLLWIAPLMTALFAWIVSGFYGFQYMTFYWWYAFLLPGTIAILCSLSHQKEEQAGKYYSVLSLPISLQKFEVAKTVIIVEKLLIASLFLALFASVSNIISPSLAVYSVGQNVLGSICIALASIWQVPLCLYLARKAGMMLPIIINTLFGILLPIVFGKSAFAWVCPYCWGAKLAEPLMGIGINGTFLGSTGFAWVIPLMLVLSISLYVIFAFLDAKVFSHKEGK